MKKKLSASSLSAFLQCPRKFFYSHELGWKPSTESVALTFGKAWHSFLEFVTQPMYYTENGEPLPYAERVYYYLEFSHDKLEEMSQDNLAMLIAMMNTYEESFYRIGTVKEAESRFTFRLPHTRWVVNGFIDAIDYDGNPIEYKTTSSDISDGSFYWLRLKANAQAVTYALSTNAKVVTYSVARKPSLKRKQMPLVDENGCKIVTDLATNERAFNKNGTPRQSAGDGFKLETREETQEEFIERLTSAMRDDNHFAVKTIDIDASMKLSVFHAYVSTAKQIDVLRKLQSKAYRADDYWSRNCTEFNCRNCPYQGICLDINYDPKNGIPQGFIKE